MSMLASAARNLKNIWSHGDEDDYADDEILDSDEPQTTSSKYGADKYPSEKYNPEKYAPSYGGSGDGSASRARSLRSVPIPLRAREKNIYTLRPKNQDEAAIAADYLKSGSAVVMNLETVERAVAVRIIDFMSGVCYGLEGQGHAMKLGDSIFLFTPAEFEISSDELDYGENRDFFFKNIDGSAPAPQTVQAKTQPAASVAAASAGASSLNAPPSAAMPQSTGNVTSSGYATADYTSPHSAKMDAPAPTSVASTPVSSSAPSTSVSSAVPVAAPRTSTLPASSVYGSGGKAHVLVGGKPASVSTPSAPQGSYQSSERRSWER